MSTPRPPCQHKKTYERLLRLVTDRNYHCKATYETVCQDCETVVPEGVAAPLEPTAREFAQKWILDRQPEPLKCMYCGKAQVLNLGPICSGATWLDTCPNSPTTSHTYQFTFGGEDERKLDSTAEMLEAYAAAVSKNLQEELDASQRKVRKYKRFCDKDTCSPLLDSCESETTCCLPCHLDTETK